MHTINKLIATVIEKDAIKYEEQDFGHDKTVPTYVNQYSKNDNAAYAQQLVQNIWFKHDNKITKAFKREAVKELMVAFMITEQMPMTIEIYHDAMFGATEYVVTSAEQLVDKMIENYNEFEQYEA